MFGKWFAQTYTGSMFGAGPSIFAVWGYVVAHAQFGKVELNPKLLTAVIGDSEENIMAALEYLCSPDPRSRSDLDNGRRLIREGQYIYSVPTFFIYMGIRSENDRREYNRNKKAESRAKKSQAPSTSESNPDALSTLVSNSGVPSTSVSNLSAHIDNRQQTTDNRQDLNLIQKQKRPRNFEKPTIAEATGYIEERKSNVDPGAFMDFYESKGWRVGNQPMKDWKAAVRTWERRETRTGKRSGSGILKVDGAKLRRDAAKRLGES